MFHCIFLLMNIKYSYIIVTSVAQTLDFYKKTGTVKQIKAKKAFIWEVYLLGEVDLGL